ADPAGAEDEEFGRGEEISLEEVVAPVERLLEGLRRLELLGQEQEAPMSQALGEPPWIRAPVEEVDLDDVRQTDQLDEGLVEDEVVEGDDVALLLEPSARRDHLRRGPHGFEDLHDHPLLGERSGEPFEEGSLGEVDESGRASGVE